jgi:hypothetical protein
MLITDVYRNARGLCPSGAGRFRPTRGRFRPTARSSNPIGTVDRPDEDEGDEGEDEGDDNVSKELSFFSQRCYFLARSAP